MKRRTFITAGGLSLAGSIGLGRSETPQSHSSPAGSVREPPRDVPVRGMVDVVVCGAGPAGVSAAVAAARKGARTLLLEAHGCLGGIWTSGLLSWILDYRNKDGLMREILQGLAERQGRAITRQGIPTNGYDVEVMKIFLERLCAQAGVQIQLHTRVCAALRNADNQLTHVITESKSGREAFEGRMFIDCTGDGDLAALAGCGFDFGHPETGRTQPMSLMGLVTGIVPEEIQAYYRETDKEPWAPPKERLKQEMERGGHSPSYSKPTLFRIRNDLFAIMANHEYEASSISASDVTRATLRARKELHRLVDGLRSLGDVWQNLRLVATAEQIGTREGRRIHGLYTVSAEDLRQGRTHEDSVCRVTFGIDVHSTNPATGKAIESAGFRSKPYDVPLRALIARDVQGLMMAGRCISGDFLAHSSYRVTGNAVAMGEAAGKTAALACQTNRLPQDVDVAQVRKQKA